MRRHPVPYWWAVMACCFCAPAYAADYSITEIPQIAHAIAVNRSGVVVGNNSQDYFVYVHSSGVVNQMAHTFILGGVNDRGQISGAFIDLDNSILPQAAVWNLSGGYQLLGEGPLSEGEQISNSGFVAGNVADVHLQDRAVLWRLSDPGATTELGTLVTSDPQFFFFDPSATAKAVNELGVVVGSSDAAVFDSGGNEIGATTHAFRWQNGTMVDLGTLPGGGASGANGINDNDEIVGESDTASGASHAFLLKGRKLRDLGDLGNDPKLDSLADAINNRSEIVGWSQLRVTDGTVAQHAFVFRDGHMRDLQSLVEPRSSSRGSVTLTEATAISCNGWIVADGFDNSSPSVSHAYLLIPREGARNGCREGHDRDDGH
jgi:probable HAF family extracellular repeat protein